MTRRLKRTLADMQAIMDHIHRHPWEDLSLLALSGLTRFTPSHFHRLFKQIAQETLYDYIRRVRIDLAAKMLLFEPSSVTQIADACGFRSLASFSRSFKQIRGIAPIEYRARYRNAAHTEQSLAVQRFRQRMTVPGDQEPAVGFDDVIAWARRSVQETTIVHLPEILAIGYRHQGTVVGRTNAAVAELFAALYREAARLGYVSNHSRMIAMSYDDPHITAPEKCRYDICMTVEGSRAKLPRNAASTIVPGGKYARLAIAQEPAVAAFLRELVVLEWLPHSGYRMDLGRPAMEVYAHAPDQDPYGRQVFDLYLPVRANPILPKSQVL
ncbi:MAG: AraC family transcriptional regulator [Paenibacillaceae bacterium]|nr:AraC family transcriptional regulator [Paenibacillaceae bacterium]